MSLGVAYSDSSMYPLVNYVIEGDAVTKELDVYHLIFAPTFACNLRCTHCYLPGHKNNLLSERLARRMVTEWAEIVSSERCAFGGIFHLKGGEPFFVSYAAPLIDEIARTRCLVLMVTTNGTVAAEDQLEALTRCNEMIDGNVIINVSLDGATEGTHSLVRGPSNFARTLRFIRFLRERNITVHINSVIHKHNVTDVGELVGLSVQEGAAQINFLPFVPKGYGESLWDWVVDPIILLEAIDNIYTSGSATVRRVLAGSYADILRRQMAGIVTSNECVGGYRGLFYVVPNGDVYSCPNLVTPSLRIGNVHNESLHALHITTRARVYEKSASCGGCASRYICKGEAFLQGPSELVTERKHHLERLRANLAARSPLGAPSALDEGCSYCFSRNL